MNGRLVWITEEQRDAIGVLLNVAGHHMPMPEHEALAWEALDGWNAAPADSAEAVRLLAFRLIKEWPDNESDEDLAARLALAVLTELGAPSEDAS